MKVFAISDPHLAIGTPRKSMEIFGPPWEGHPNVLASRWRKVVAPDDIVLIPGDISWAIRLEGAIPDLRFLGNLPGRKILLRGNHDYWWSSASKVRSVLPEGMEIVQNSVVNIDGVSIGGTRLWDDREIGWLDLPLRPPTRDGKVWQSLPLEMGLSRSAEENEKIFVRELGRLRNSLSRIDPNARFKVAMVHYPPLRLDMGETRTTAIIEESGVAACVFGHLHGLLPATEKPLFGMRNGVDYRLTSCDYLEFDPLLLAEL